MTNKAFVNIVDGFEVFKKNKSFLLRSDCELDIY